MSRSTSPHHRASRTCIKRTLILLLLLLAPAGLLFAKGISLSLSLSPDMALMAWRFAEGNANEISGYNHMMEAGSIKVDAAVSGQVMEHMAIGASAALIPYKSAYMHDPLLITPLYMDISYTPAAGQTLFPITLSLGGYAAFYGGHVSFGPAARLSFGIVANAESGISVYTTTSQEVHLAFDGNDTELYWHMSTISVGIRFNLGAGGEECEEQY